MMQGLLNRLKSWIILGFLASSSAFGAVLDHDYVRINPAQPTDNPRKVEVIEVFSYACPHCSSLAPQIEPWAKKLPANVVYKRIPVSFGRAQWATLARAYYTLEALNQVDLVHEKIFTALHKEHIDLTSEDTLFDWMAKQGINRQKFIDTYHSFTVQSKVQRGDQKAMSYGVDAVPTVIVDGKYRTEPSMTGSNTALFPVLDDLIQLATREKGQ